MAITNLKVSNFKSFKDLDLNLGRFNVVIGANASGKSNFVEIFRFLRTLEQESLEDTVSLHYGHSSILNKRLASSESLRMRATSDRQMPWGGGWANLQVHETTYEFCLHISGPPSEVLIEDEHFAQKLRTSVGDEDAEMTLDIAMSNKGQRTLQLGPQDVVDQVERHGQLSTSTQSPIGSPCQHLEWLSSMVELWPSKILLIHRSLFGLIGRLEDSPCGQVGVYDIDPQVVKRPQPKAGRLSLEEHGENLDLVLRDRLADQEKRRKFHNLLRYVLPFAVEVGVEDLGTSLLLKLREEYYEDSLLANLLSDGTADVVALITALFFEDKDVVIIEEPERNIHPRLISGLVELMKDAARTKQVIVTTHSPEFVKHAGLESLLLISRDKEGFSTISRPAEKEAVKIFLQNDLGLDDLFVQDVLAAP